VDGGFGGFVSLRIVIAEDSLLVRAGIQQVLDSQPDLRVIRACGNLPELIEAVDADPPDAVVTDVRMPPDFGDEGIQAATAFRQRHPNLGVVVLSQYAESTYARVLLEGGTAGRAYLLKERVSEPGQLADAVRAVAAGGSVVDPAVVELLLSVSGKTRDSPLALLTARELEVLEHIAQGKSNSAVAAALFLTERTVETHINALFTKLGLNSEPDVNRRVKAVLMILSARRNPPRGS
jgi:DNA-binding NarL/FixJ family response regulator